MTLHHLDPDGVVVNAIVPSWQPSNAKVEEVVRATGRMGHLIKTDLGAFTVDENSNPVPLSQVMLDWKVSYFTNHGEPVNSAGGSRRLHRCRPLQGRLHRESRLPVPGMERDHEEREQGGDRRLCGTAAVYHQGGRASQGKRRPGSDLGRQAGALMVLKKAEQKRVQLSEKVRHHLESPSQVDFRIVARDHGQLETADFQKASRIQIIIPGP